MSKVTIALTTVFFIVGWGIGLAIQGYLTLPIVQFNQSGECITIIDYTGNKTPCTVIPEKYVHEHIR